MSSAAFLRRCPERDSGHWINCWQWAINNNNSISPNTVPFSLSSHQNWFGDKMMNVAETDTLYFVYVHGKKALADLLHVFLALIMITELL